MIRPEPKWLDWNKLGNSGSSKIGILNSNGEGSQLSSFEKDDQRLCL
jgi:hypothetical protein